jgi:hypothetical protein
MADCQYFLVIVLQRCDVFIDLNGSDRSGLRGRTRYVSGDMATAGPSTAMELRKVVECTDI